MYQLHLMVVYVRSSLLVPNNTLSDFKTNCLQIQIYIIFLNYCPLDSKVLMQNWVFVTYILAQNSANKNPNWDYYCLINYSI